MQNYADAANELIERIDAGEIDPEDVDITPFVEREDAVLTPGLADRLPESKIREYSDRVRQRDERDLQEQQREQYEDHNQALERLRDPDAKRTATAELLTGAEIEVKLHTNAKIDKHLTQLDDASTPSQVVDDIIEVIHWFVVDGELAERKLWQDYATEYGAADLMRECMRIIEPYLDDIDDDDVVRKFRSE